MTLPLGEAALQYAEAGVAVFALAPRSKVPMRGSHGVLDATVEPAIILGWWSETPDANLGIRTGPLFWALDVDVRHGGIESMTDLSRRHGRLPETVRQRTPSGGWHLLFRPRDEMRCRTGIRPGVDVRGHGGAIVGAPSSVAAGLYRRLPDIPAAAMLEAIAEAPAWLLEMALPAPLPAPVERGPIRCSRQAAHAVVGILRSVVSAQPGRRNGVLFWAACRLGALAKQGLVGWADAESALIQAGTGGGLKRSEARATVRSGMKRGGR